MRAAPGPPRHRLPRLEARGVELERARAGAGVADAGARDADVAVGQRRAAAADGQRDVRSVLGLLAQAVDDAALRRRLALGLGHDAVVRAIDRHAERHGSGRGGRLRLRRRTALGATRRLRTATTASAAPKPRCVHARAAASPRAAPRIYTFERAPAGAARAVQPHGGRCRRPHSPSSEVRCLPQMDTPAERAWTRLQDGLEQSSSQQRASRKFSMRRRRRTHSRAHNLQVRKTRGARCPANRGAPSSPPRRAPAAGTASTPPRRRQKPPR